MARPPIKPPTKQPEVYRRGAPTAAPAGKPDNARAENATLPATPVAKASAPAASEPPPFAPHFGPYLPAAHRFARDPVDLATLRPIGEAIHLPELEGVPDEELAGAIARALNETAPAPRELIRLIGAKCGAAFLRARYAKTRKVEARGGKVLKNQQRRRTSGGCFLGECARRMPVGSFATLSSLALLAVGLTPCPSYPPCAEGHEDAPQLARRRDSDI